VRNSFAHSALRFTHHAPRALALWGRRS